MARNGFYDLNIVVERSHQDHMETLKRTLKMAYKLGYDSVAINTILEDDTNSGGKKKGAIKPIPGPIEIDVAEIVGAKPSLYDRQFRILNRLTVIITELNNASKLSNPQASKYDILAVQPTDEKSFKMSCTTLDVDIISLAMTKQLTMPYRSNQARLAISRGIFFEIKYAPSFCEAFARRHTIANSILISEICKRKNIFVTSEAKKPLDIRAPYDVMKMCAALGFNPAESKSTITASGRSIILKSETRRFGKGVVKIERTSLLSKDDLWKIGQCKNGQIVSIVKLDEQLDLKLKRPAETTTDRKAKKAKLDS